eukprot:308556_1
MSDLITIKKPNAVDPSLEVSGDCYNIKDTLKHELGFTWNGANRAWEIVYKTETVFKSSNQKKRKNIIKTIKNLAKDNNISVHFENVIGVNNEEDECEDISNSKRRSNRIHKKAPSHAIDESLMNSNNKYTAGRTIDGKRINTSHAKMWGDEAESEPEKDRLSVYDRNDRIEIQNVSYKNTAVRSMLKETFQAQWDPNHRVWWCNKYNYSLKDVQKYLHENGLLSYTNDDFDEESEAEYDGDYKPNPYDVDDKANQFIVSDVDDETSEEELSSWNSDFSTNNNNRKRKLKKPNRRLSKKPKISNIIKVSKLRKKKVEFKVIGNNNITFVKNEFEAKLDKKKNVWYVNKDKILLKLLNER